MPRSRYRFGKDNFPHFITNTVVAWLPVFSQPAFARVIFDSWRFLQRERSIRIISFVVMENHVHWIAVGPELSRRVGEFKSFTATSILREAAARGYQTLLQEMEFFKNRHKIDQQHQFWGDGSHPQQIESDDMMWQKIEYIHNNPVRRGYILDPLHWCYSSAKSYAGQPGILDVCTDWH
jgi:REP element-mobilizing transposase RayT